MRTSSFWTVRWDRGATTRVGRLLLLLLLAGLCSLVFPPCSKNEGRFLAGVANNLRILEGAKEQWALEHHATNGAPPTAADLAPYLKNGEFIKPAVGERYTINPVGVRTTATLTREVAGWEAGRVLTVDNF